jgi:hypothetical protein
LTHLTIIQNKSVQNILTTSCAGGPTLQTTKSSGKTVPEIGVVYVENTTQEDVQTVVQTDSIK